MKVKELKKLLERVPDEALIVVEGLDHNYNYAYLREDFAIREGDNLAMFYNQEGTKIPVLFFSS